MSDLSEKLDAIARREQEATEGPWEMAVSADRKWALILASSGTAEEYHVARAVDDEDAAFIAAARTNVPFLLALVREQAAKLAAIEKMCDETQQGLYGDYGPPIVSAEAVCAVIDAAIGGKA